MSKTFKSKSTADKKTSTADDKVKVSPSKMNPNSEGLLKQFLFEADENDLIEAAKRIKEMKNHWKNFNKKSRKVNHLNCHCGSGVDERARFGEV
jgi:hypothetical protein